LDIVGPDKRREVGRRNVECFADRPGVVGHQDPRKSDRRVVAKGCLPAKFATAGKPG
jgi:hypothetical protein